MKKFISILLISSILAGAASFDEFIKIPILIQHYKDHKESNSGISFFTFLYNHYLTNQKAESDNDKKSNEKLPFKSAPRFHSANMQAIFQTEVVMLVDRPIVTFPFIIINTKVKGGAFDIWQPPKV